MERITGAGGASSAQPIFPRLAAFGVDAAAPSSVSIPRDHVEISPLGQMLDGISRLPEIRHERVEAIRQQIAAGTYETPEKIQVALDRLMDELSGF